MDYKTYIVARGLNRTSLELALDLIFAATQLQFPIDKIRLGTPSAVELKATGDEPNTYIPITVNEVYDDRYDTPAVDGVLYNRIPLTLIPALADVDFKQPGNVQYTIYSILDQINAKLQVQFTQDDVLDQVITGNNAYIIIKANPKSTVWIGDFQLWFDGMEALQGGRITEDENLRVTEDGNIRVTEDF